MNLFSEEFINTAIDRIRRFAQLADKMGFEIVVGFSGGKDSQVVYDLCKRAGIDFKAYYNVSFESRITKKFIKENYPDVIWRKDYKYGWIQNIGTMHDGMLPTVEHAYCCEDYKHNPKYVDECSIIGVRKQESAKRKSRTVLSAKNKKIIKKNPVISDYFADSCQSVGTQSVIQLSPIFDWSEKEVWDYIRHFNIPINPEYSHSRRVGCMICPKATITHNLYYLMKYPKLVDAIILQKEKNPKYDWIITSDGKDYKDDKVYYICRWLNYSFRPFSKKQEMLYQLFRKYYDSQTSNREA